MISKSQIQLVNALRINKFRSLHQKFVVEGPKIVGELLSSDLVTDTVFATNDWILENSPEIPANTNIVKVKPRELERVSAMKTPHQVVAIADLLRIRETWEQLSVQLTGLEYSICFAQMIRLMHLIRKWYRLLWVRFSG